MQKIGKIFAICLGLLLPWHGLITVFSPDPYRLWKEVCLVLLLLSALFMKAEVVSLGEKIKGYIKHLFGKDKKDRGNFWQRPIFWAALFLIWIGMSAGVEQDYYSSVAARYLGLGFFVFIIFSIFLRKLGKKSTDFFDTFSAVVVWSTALSVLFGIWAKFGGGFEVLENFYANTISSWVPGQTIPIYHQVGDFIRMQGGASGPVEFGHLLLVGLFLMIRNEKFAGNFIKFLVLLLLMFGIFQSGSRTAFCGGIVLTIYFFLQILPRKKVLKSSDRILKYTRILFWIILSTAFVKIVVLSFLPEKEVIDPTEHSAVEIVVGEFSRASDSDHFTRPMQAIEDGLDTPIMGDLGSYGPAARERNLINNNDDKAPIAENVFADYFVQLGLLGLFLGLAFWYNLLRFISRKDRLFILIAFVLANFATIFDMTPISILYFAVFAFLGNQYVRVK